MTDWLKDLQELLGEAVELTPGLSSINEIQSGDWGGAATAPITSILDLLNTPSSFAKEQIGTVMAAPNLLFNAIGQGNAGTAATARRWEEDPSGRAEWEHFIQDKPMLLQAITELAIDPLNWVGVGAVGKVPKAVSAANAAFDVAPKIARQNEAIAGSARALDIAFNQVPYNVAMKGIRPVARGARAGIQKVAPNAFELTPESRLKRTVTDISGAFDEWLDSRKGLQRFIPAPIPSVTKSLAPFESYDVPPFFDKDFDEGVPNAVKRLAWESWQQLRMSQPDIPGVNVPGMGEVAPWRTTARETFNNPRFSSFANPGQQATTQDPGILAQIAQKFQGPAGFVNIPHGGYADPGSVRIDEDNLRHMANIGAAVIMDFDNDVSNKMFGSLVRTMRGGESVRNALIQEYGAGIEPFIPAIHEEMTRILRDQGSNFGDVRFLTRYGLPEGTVPTDRLNAIQDRIDSGKITPEEGLALAMGSKFSKASPEAVETAAGMGAGFMMAGDLPTGVDPFSGPFAIPGLDPNTGRAMIPEALTNQFQANRDAYDTYMTSLFPGLSRAELDTLRQMSIETVYDEMINAAGFSSGGAQGATRIFEEGPGFERGGETFGKIGVYGGDDPGAIANRLEEIGTDWPRLRHGKPSIKMLNTREYQKLAGKAPTKGDYTELTGKKAPGRDLKEEHIAEMITALGGTPFTFNPRGGPLPALSTLIDAFNAGKDIPVGDFPASEWYSAAVDEVMNIVGPGRYEDAMMLIDLMAVTSAGTEVALNARNAIRAFAEWKLGSDETIRRGLGLTEEQADQILNRTQRWTPERPSETYLKADKKGTVKEASRPVTFAEDANFLSAMAASQKQEVGRLFANYVERRANPSMVWTPNQGGPKTNNFAGSFIIKLWNDAVDYAIPDGAFRDKVKKALNDAATIYTVDRHDVRLSNQATAVTPMGAIANREQRLILSKHIPDVRPEDVQAALWYWSKDQQGFLRINRDDDMAQALRTAWNAQKDPATVAEVRQRIRAENPNISEEELSLIADDIMRQEVVMSIVSDALKGSENEAAKLLGDRVPLQGLFELGNDTLGIVNRAGRGVAPRRKASIAIPNLVNTAEQVLGQINRGELPGVTLGFDGSEFVPEQPATGFAVALTSAGASVSTGRTKTSAKAINEFLSKYGDLLDEPGMADRIKFGLFEMDDPTSASFDLTIVVPDEATAVAVAKKANQKAIYNFATGQVIETGGSGEPVITAPRQVKEIIESVFGPAERSRSPVESSLARGATIDEMDSVNPISILQRRVVRPLMERYEENSARRFLEKAPRQTPTQTPGGGVLSPPPGVDPVTPFDFSAIGHDPLLSTQANTLLGQTFDGGETYGQRLQRYFRESEEDIQRLDDNNISWGPTAKPEDRVAAADGLESVQEMIRKYNKMGVDIRYASARDLAILRMSDDLAKKEGVTFDKFSAWDLVRAAWGEQALFSPKYHLGNIQGAWLQNAFGGTFRVGTPSEFLAAFKLARGGLDKVAKSEALRSLHAYQVAQKWGFDELPSYLSRGGVRSMVSTSGERISGSAMGELAGRVTRSRRIGEAVGRPFEANADFSQAAETVMRGALWSDVLDREMTAAMAVIEDDIQIMAQRQGIQNFEFSVLNNINPVPGGPSSRKLKDHLKNMGFSDGYAERAGRNFAEARNIAEKMAKAEVDKRQFSYERTNLDEFVGKFIPFHYWISRAIRYYGEESLRHPYLIVNYMRLNEGIEAAQDDPGLSARQKGFLRLMGTPLGFSVLMNPEAMFGVVKIFGLDSQYTPEGETEAGATIRWLKERGMGLYPWIDGTLNLMGVFGDTFEPDLLGIRHKTLIGSVVNFMRSQLGMDPAAAPYQTAMGQARYNISTFVSQFTPDWLAQPVLPKAGGNTTEATMDTIIESRIIANNPGMTNQALLDIMTNPESPEYIEAFQQVATAGVAQQLLNFTLPQNYRIREDTRDVRNAQIQTIAEAAEAAGVSPYEFQPRAGDVEFGSTYERLTGHRWAPGHYSDAKIKSDISRATGPAKQLVLDESEYYVLGSVAQQRVFRKYQALRNGDDPQTLGMDEDARRELADLWATQHGHMGDINHVYELRNAFEQTHPEFAQFKNWQDQMFSLRNHLGGSLQEYRRQASAQNPNAAKYFEETLSFVQQNYPQDQWESEIERRTTNADAYQAINGIPDMRYDSAPIPGVPPVDVTLPGMAMQNQPQGNFTPDWVRSLQGGVGYGMGTYNTWWNQ